MKMIVARARRGVPPSDTHSMRPTQQPACVIDILSSDIRVSRMTGNTRGGTPRRDVPYEIRHLKMILL